MGRDATSATPEELLAEIDWVRRVAHALVGRDESDEVVQQTYLQAISRPPAAGPIRSWLRTVLRNVVRRQARDKATRALHERTAPPAAPVLEPDETVARAELHRAVVDTVLALEEPYRRTLLLRFLEEREVAAIAEITKSPEATVRTRIRRGLEQVREALQARATRGGCDATAAQALLFVRLSEFARSGGSGAATAGAGAGATAVAGTVATGGALMSLATKWALAGAVLAAASVTIWVAGRPGTKPTRIEVGASSARPQIAPEMATTGPPPTAAREEEPIGDHRSSTASPSSDGTAATSPAASSVVGTVRGTVIDDRSGEPVGGADVWILAAYGQPFDALDDAAALAAAAVADRARALARYAPAATATTAADGRFECDKLSSFSDWKAIAFDVKGRCAISDAIRFDETKTSRDVELRLASTVVLKGRVTDADQAPIVGAKVIVSRMASKGWHGFQMVETQSTPQPGSWTLGPMAATSAEVTAEMKGFERPPTWRHFDIAPDQRELVIDLVLERSDATSIRGPIVDATGTPIALLQSLPILFGEASLEEDVRRHLSIGAIQGTPPIPAPGSLVSAWEKKPDDVFPGRVVPEQNGYEIALPSPFSGLLYLEADSCVVGTARIEDVAHPPPLPFDRSGVVPPAPPATLVVGLVDRATGVRVDVHRDEISVVPAVPKMASFDVAREARNPSGQIVCEFDVHVGRMIVTFNRHRFVTTTAEVVVNDAGERHIVELPLVPATASIRGHVAVEDVTVEDMKWKPAVLLSIYVPSPQGFDAVSTAPILVNEAGRFEIAGLAPQEYAVVVASPRSVPVVEHVRAADPPPELDLSLEHGESVEFHVARPRGICGLADVMWRILDAEGVPLDNSFHPGVQRTTQDGKVGATLAPGHYKALFWSGGCREAMREFDVPTEGLIEVQLARAR